MYRIYEIWKAYALFVVSAFGTYFDRTDHLPAPIVIGIPLVIFITADYFISQWVSWTLFAGVVLPHVWFYWSLFRDLHAHRSNRADQGLIVSSEDFRAL